MPDLLIIGAGPAGCAAAIQARRAGLSVGVLETKERTRPAPGETLHPGVEPLFDRLGIRESVRKASFHRHRGVWIAWDRPPRFETYGRDKAGAWLGFQADRQVLQGILLDAALDAGAKVEQGATADKLVVEMGRVTGVVANGRELRARWIADGTGRNAFIARALRLAAISPSPPIRVHFGWQGSNDTDLDGQPRLTASADGWEWRAPLGDGRTAWVSLHVKDDSIVPIPGSGMDLSWRCYAASAGTGYILLGDAATILDPASSHGVLRALMSGMLCAHLVHAHICQGLPEAAAIAHYRRWLREQFDYDVYELRKLYRQHPSSQIAALFSRL